MIKQLKFSLKMLKYGHSITTNVLGMVLCALVGLVLLIIPVTTPGSVYARSNTQIMAGFLLSMSGIFLVQIWMTLNSSGIVLSSPRSRASLCSIPTIMASCFVLGGFTLVLAIRLIFHGFFPGEWQDISRELYLLGGMIFLITIFFAFAYRYFILSTILFLVVFYIYYFAGFLFLHNLQALFPDSVFFTMPVTLVICYGIILAGIALNWLFTYLLRKKPMDKWAQGSMLRKYL